MLAACVNDDDVFRVQVRARANPDPSSSPSPSPNPNPDPNPNVFRVQTPLTILNQFPPFSRASNKWRPIELPAVTLTLTPDP